MIVVAIDGPAGVGKSSVAARVATELGYRAVNSGTFYRAVSFEALRRSVVDAEAIVAIARDLDLRYRDDGHVVNGVPVTEADLHAPSIDAVVANHSAITAVRAAVNARIRAYCRDHDVVVEGRDITTVVFPDAPVKIYLDAAADERARRRSGQSGVDPRVVADDMLRRDGIDRTKPVGRLQPAQDAIYIDTTHLTLGDVCAKLIAITHDILSRGRSDQQSMTDNEAAQADTFSTRQTTQQEMQQQFLEQLEELEEGQLVGGTVVQISGDEVFIDIGYKAEGRIPVNEFDTPPGIGDSVEVVLIRKDIRNGGVAVSKRKADEKRFWNGFKQAFNERRAIDGEVVKAIKGGFEVRLHGRVRGFNPISKMDTRRIDEPEEYIGLQAKFYIERIYGDNHRVNIVLSRRAWLEEQTEKQRDKFFSEVTIGDEVEGTVKSFTSFGAFIDLGGFDGLLHVNDMSWGHVTRPKDYVKKGDAIRLKVIRMDPDAQKINLSLRHMTPDPWESFEDRYYVDQVVPGTVTKLTDFGAFVELEAGIEGLIHISEMSWVQRIKHPREVLKAGQAVETKILDYDIQSGRVQLGLKQVFANPWDDIDHRYPPGMRITSTIKKITATGAFIEIEKGIDAFLHVDDLSWTKRYKNPGALLSEGQEVEVVVLLSDPEQQNIRVGIKQLDGDPWQQLADAYPPKSTIEGAITNITDFGIFLRVQGGIEGLINKSGVSDPRQESYEDAVKRYSVGDTLKVVITEINPSRQRLSLSIRELERQEQRQELQKYIHDDGGGTVTLGDMLKDKREP